MANISASLGLACCLVMASAGARSAYGEQKAGDPEATGKPVPDKARKGEQIDPKADALMHRMSETLAAAKSFQFDAQHVQEVVTTDGQKLQFLAQSRVMVQRPNKLRSERIGPIADLTLYYDGDDITIYGKRANLYATADAPDTLDEAIEFARGELDLEAPGADLLYSDVYAGLMEDVVSGMYVGKEPIGDRMCHHLAFRGKETDWQIWIEDGPQALPCRYVITSKDVKGSPEYSVDLESWKLAPFEASRFAFAPPPDATKIEFWTAARARQEALKKQQRVP